MPTISELKELEVTQTPLLLFECRLRTGACEYWSTHAVTVEGKTYQPRVLSHQVFEIGMGSEDGIDGISRVSINLANADSYFSQIERNTGWKGSRLTVGFVFYDLRQNIAASETAVLFQGMANSPDEITESTLRLSFTNRLNLQRVLIPSVHIQKRCPWVFPSSAAQRIEAVTGGNEGKYSPFFRCGYSPDVEGGTGNVIAGEPYTVCGYTRPDCVARGMFSVDGAGHVTRRFGGIEFVPSTILVRGYGERGSHVSAPLENSARYDDFIPMVYGTAWYQPPVVFARNDGNLTRTEVLLGMGEIQGVLKVLVNDFEIPLGQSGSNMTATGWYNLVSPGNRTGNFNYDFTGSGGQPLGDPYGSMAILSVVVPNRVADGRALPRIQVLLEGMKVSRFDLSGGYLDEAFTNNPAWVLLDVLRRSGWPVTDIDVQSFAVAAQYCEETISTTDLNGNPAVIPRFQCNLVLRRRRSAADVVRGIRNGSALFLSYSPTGQLQLRTEGTLALQQPVKPAGSNSIAPLNGGWPAYEFGDGSSGFGGILRRENGEPSLRIRTRSSADSPNRISAEFQDAFNEYQQDSLSLVDFADAVASGHEVATALRALGLPNASQAARILRLTLDKAIRGNTILEFETSVRGVGLRPGDIITLTYQREGFQRQPFRIIRLAPALNHSSTTIAAQIHDDAWYTDSASEGAGERRRAPFEVGLPRPLIGTIFGPNGDSELEITEQPVEETDGGGAVVLAVGFIEPRRPTHSAIGIPLLSLAPTVNVTGGSIAGGQTLYYGVSAIDAGGSETPLSFLARAVIPTTTNTNVATLQNLSFPAGTTGFHVYRGKTPAQLMRIAATVTVATSFADAGSVPELAGPPDENFDHANLYWRLELLTEQSATIATATTIGNSTLQMLPNEYRGKTVRITAGKGDGQERAVLANDATTIIVALPWQVNPDSSSIFVVSESTWHFAATGSSSPIEFTVPNREGATVHISARSANIADQECAYELSPLSSWRIGGAAGSTLDTNVPGEPTFGLGSAGRGMVEIVGPAFSSLDNTRSIAAATIRIWYWDELSSPTAVLLTGSVDGATEYVDLSAAGTAQPGELIQIDAEVLGVVEVLSAGLRYRVSRGSHQSTSTAHPSAAPVYHLEQKTFIASFARDFFGSPASGSYSFPMTMPNARIAAAELFVTNVRGNSPTALRCFTATTDYGIRTMSGGQLTIQVDGYLAIQADAAPPLVMDTTRAARDIFAMVRQAPTEVPIELRLKQSGTTYCLMTIAVGSTISNTVNGFGLPPLLMGSDVSLDIVSVGQTATSLPGRDLTVTVRF